MGRYVLGRAGGQDRKFRREKLAGQQPQPIAGIAAALPLNPLVKTIGRHPAVGHVIPGMKARVKEMLRALQLRMVELTGSANPELSETPAS